VCVCVCVFAVMSATRAHNLEEQYFRSPTWCSLCHDFIWGTKVLYPSFSSPNFLFYLVYLDLRDAARVMRVLYAIARLIRNASINRKCEKIAVSGRKTQLA
jgi:hypothetical protein